MINYGLSKQQFTLLKQFSDIFNKDSEDMILDCILLILCIWNEDKNQLINGRGLNPSVSEIDMVIELPNDVEDELYELSDDHDLSVHDCINGIIGLVLEYLEESWDDESFLEMDNVTDQDKMKELKRVNNIEEEHCWNKFFT